MFIMYFFFLEKQITICTVCTISHCGKIKNKNNDMKWLEKKLAINGTPTGLLFV